MTMNRKISPGSPPDYILNLEYTISPLGFLTR